MPKKRRVVNGDRNGKAKSHNGSSSKLPGHGVNRIGLNGNGKVKGHNGNGGSLAIIEEPLLLKVNPSGSIKSQPDFPENTIYLTPRLVNHQKRVVNDVQAERFSVTPKRNTSSFYCELYDAIFGSPEFEFSRNFNFRTANNEFRSFKPDLTRKGLYGTEYVEIKSISTRKSQVPCRVEQAENYLRFLLKAAIDRDEERPSVNYVFVRYGDKKNLNLGKSSKEELAQIHSTSTRDMLIAPANLVLLLLALSRTEILNNRHETKERLYRIIPGSALNLLHVSEGSSLNLFLRDYEKLSKHYLNRKRRGDFFHSSDQHSLEDSLERADALYRTPASSLKNLGVTRFMSDQRNSLAYGKTPVQPFPITVYYNKDEKSWLDNFSNHHEKLFKLVRMRDLYAEQEKNRLKLAQERASIPRERVPF